MVHAPLAFVIINLSSAEIKMLDPLLIAFAKVVTLWAFWNVKPNFRVI